MSSNPSIRFKIEAVEPGKDKGYPSFSQLIKDLPKYIRVEMEDSQNDVAVLWRSPGAPPAHLTGRAVWLKTDDVGRAVSMFHWVNGEYQEVAIGDRVGDLKYRVPTSGNDGPWRLANGGGGTEDLTGDPSFSLGNTKIHQYVGEAYP